MMSDQIYIPSAEEFYRIIEESVERDSIKTPEEVERLNKQSAEYYKTSIMRLYYTSDSSDSEDSYETKRKNKFENSGEDDESKSEPLAAMDDMTIVEANLQRWREFMDKEDDCKQLPKKYICVYCNHTYSNAKVLEDHNKKRCVREYKCKSCHKTFAKKEHYEKHMKRKKKCIMKSDYMCKYCKKAYATDGNMRRHMNICKSKITDTTVEEKAKPKIREIDKHIKEYNDQDNKNLLNFSITESMAEKFRERFSIRDLDKIADYLENKDCDKLVEFIIEKIHYSDNYKKYQNIRYIEKLDKYIIYDGQWKNKSNEIVLGILQKEVEFTIYLAMSASDIPGNTNFMEILGKNKKLLDEYNYTKTQVDTLKNVQKKYDESKK